MIIYVFMVLEELSRLKLGEKWKRADNVHTCRYSRLEMTVRKQDSSSSSTGARARPQGACTHLRVRTPDTPGNMAALMTLSQVTSRITLINRRNNR